MDENERFKQEMAAALRKSREIEVPLKRRLFWLSWEQPTEDYRPLTYPPNKQILGWWCSGSGEDYWTICAYIEAEGDNDARAAVLKDWPEAFDRGAEWRIFQECDKYAPSDRFPPGDWMEPRLEKWR
jgi:hypothetical protein